MQKLTILWDPNPKFPLDTCPLRCSSDLVLLRHPPSGNPHRLVTQDRSYRSVLLKTITRSVAGRRVSSRDCLFFFFFEICVLVSTRSVLFWKVAGSCLFSAWLPVCSVLNSAELLRRAAYQCWRAPDCRSWDGADTQRSGPGGDWHID